MQSLLSLDDYFMAELAVKWNQLKPEPGPIEYKLSINYNLQQHTTEDNKFRLIMWVDNRSNGDSGYEIAAEIVGIFSFKSECDDEKKIRLLYYNGLSMLYGILRGQVVNVTGSFKGGKYLLPSVNMVEIVNRSQSSAEKNDNPPAS